MRLQSRQFYGVVRRMVAVPEGGGTSSRLLKISMVRAIFVVFAGKQPE